jgi:hypothetical protein
VNARRLPQPIGRTLACQLQRLVRRLHASFQSIKSHVPQRLLSGFIRQNSTSWELASMEGWRVGRPAASACQTASLERLSILFIRCDGASGGSEA